MSCWFQNCIDFPDWPYFSGRRKLLTHLNHKGPPLWWKIWIFSPKAVFDSSKEASWCTECNAKDPSSLKSTIPEKIKKNCQKYPFFWVKNAIIGGFSRFIQERYIAESWGLLRCIECTRTLLLSYQNQHSDNFLNFHHDFGWLKVYVYH